MSATAEIRTAETEDLPDLLALYALMHPNDPPTPPDEAEVSLAQIGRYPGSAVLVAMQDATLAASVTLIIVPNLTRGGAPYALIENVVTHPDHRRMGLGTALLHAAAERAWAAGCYKIMLMTGSKEASTLAFYEQAGFAQSKTGFQIRRPTTE